MLFKIHNIFFKFRLITLYNKHLDETYILYNNGEVDHIRDGEIKNVFLIDLPLDIINKLEENIRKYTK